MSLCNIITLKSISTLAGIDNVRVTVLSYICEYPNCTYSCEFEKSGWSNPLKHLLIYWTPDKLASLVAQMKKEVSVIITEFMVPEKDI